MAMLTIRNLDESLKSQLRIRAAEHGCSMEEEVRRILRQVLAAKKEKAPSGLGSRIHQRMKQAGGGAEIPIPKRTQPRSAPDFSEH